MVKDMIYILLLTVASVAKLSFPILSNEKTMKVLNHYTNFNGSLKLSAFPLTEIKHEEFIIKVGLGYPPQVMNLGLNLNDTVTYVSGNNCACHKSEHKYTPFKSPNFKIGNGVSFNQYSYHYLGYWVFDDILIASKYVNYFEFIMVTKDNDPGYFSADGFIGLGPYSGNYNFNILSLLKRMGIIKQQIFSVYINNQENIKKQSCITLGYWDPLEYAQGGSSKVLKLANDSYSWTVKASNLIIDDWFYSISHSLAFNFNIQSIKLPKDHFDNYFLPYLANNNCSTIELDNKESYLICMCEADYPYIGYNVNGWYIKIYKEFYLKKEKNGLCTVQIQRNLDSNVHILGLPYFKAYYTMFDLIIDIFTFKKQ
jgi:hypothetical protein